MSALRAPDSEPVTDLSDAPTTITAANTTNVERDHPAYSDHIVVSSSRPESHHGRGTDVISPVKREDTDDESLTTDTGAGSRSVAIPSVKRRRSDAETPPCETAERRDNKRKRGPSPPWQFPTVQAATMKSSDGRRVSARVNTTPAHSESEGRSRPRSESHPVPKSRPASPPWKGFAAGGPTSINIDGKRKSGRVNKDLAEKPKRVSPRSRKQVEKLEEELLEVKARRGTATSNGPAVTTPKRRAAADRVSSSPLHTIADLQAQIAALKPSRSFPTPAPGMPQSPQRHKRKQSGEARSHLPGSPIDTRPLQRPELSLSPKVTRPPPRIKLRLNSVRPVVPPPHPNAVSWSPARPPRRSLYQIIDDYELREMQQPYMENERGPPNAEYFAQRNEKLAVEEAVMRSRILKAAEPGGALSKERFSLYQADAQPGPPEQYGHHDHLVAQALWLRQLQVREKAAHRLQAKKVAHEALDYWRVMSGPTEEDIRVEQDKITKLVYKQVVVDIQAKWELVNAHVQQLRKERWEAVETLKRQERLQRQLERSEQMIARQRGDYHSDANTDDEEQNSEDEESDVAELEDSAEENMSESQNESGGEGEMDEDELAQYLAQRDIDPPETDRESASSDEDDELQDALPDTSTLVNEDDEDDDTGKDFQPEVGLSGQDVGDQELEDDQSETTRTYQPSSRSRRSESAAPSRVQIDTEVDLSSDESVDMHDSDEDMSSTSNEDSGDEEEQGVDAESDAGAGEAEQSTLGLLFTSKQIKAVTGLPTPTTSTEGDNRDQTADVVSDDSADLPRGAVVAAALPTAKSKAIVELECQELLTEAGLDKETNASQPAASDVPQDAARTSSPHPSDWNSKALVPIPSLLVAQLRSYQHAGLDWLASLYRSDTNGILADEMGLGKTIQTISLLAHIAERYDVWETHLIIVPTSVVLNWVTEFHKFLPGFRVLGYYGSIEERALKRKHWANDPHHSDHSKRGYNVVITSYSVAQQDMNALKVVKWHYMVLDEAHNIRNFQSLRWQSLIKVNTKARLLLTGTPLQNSLTELWSLLTFLTAGDDDPAHGNLEEFLSHWKDPVKEIFESGVTALSAEAQKVVDQLHISLRPFLLRRLKSEVEKDLPKKIESVVVCKLSKRQRQLYQEYMGLASTRESLRRGTAVTAGSVLLSLRKVCNHPDLFDPRPIQTSFAMQDSAAKTIIGTEQLVRRMLGVCEDLPTGLILVAHEGRRKRVVKRSRQLAATRVMKNEIAQLEQLTTSTPDTTRVAGCLALQRLYQRNKKLQLLRESIRVTEESLRDSPVYGSDLRELLTVQTSRPYYHAPRGRKGMKSLRGWPVLSRRPLQFEHQGDSLLASTTNLQQDVMSLDKIAERMKDVIIRFAFCTPVATAPVLDLAISPRVQELIRESDLYPSDNDFAHEARTRSSIAFPDSRLLIYDAGKLQRLYGLLRDLQSRGSRSLIFTQMTGTLDILERFLNLLNLPYLRLDGSTPIEKRQLYAAEFNRPDSRYQCMILSSRAGGVGLNLTGASSVIFYDLDWNPQMDRQCMDRAHRIGQMRDVEVYKMVSEKTVEENILRRANQKSLLDQTVIQEGHFTTEYQAPNHRATDERQEQVMDDAIERYLGGNDKARMKAMESVEDKEDFQAAQRAGKEDKQDELEFVEVKSSAEPSGAATPGPVIEDETEDGIDRRGHVDRYMIRELERWWGHTPYVPAPVRRLDKHGRDPSHRAKKRR